MSVNVQSLFDLAAWTRSHEYRKGSYVALTEPLPDYPLFNVLMTREVLESTPTLRFQVLRDRANSARVTQVGEPVQVVIPQHATTVAMNWCKMDTVWGYYGDEEAFNGADADKIVDVVVARKMEHDNELRRLMEQKLAGNASEVSKNDITGLRDWLPADASATDLELNGGADVVYGVSGISVAEVPRWGHAVAGWNTLSDDDAFHKISEFLLRSKYYVPEGAKTIDTGAAKRCCLVNHKTFLHWEKVQTSANDDLRDDVGIWRGAIKFMSMPVKYLPVMSEPDSPVTPTDEALIYVLDLNTWKMFIHRNYNFKLSPPVMDPFTPDAVHQWRQVYAQLACVNREKNLVMRTTNPQFVVG